MIAWVCGAALAAAVAGCSDRAQVFESKNESWFTRPFFEKPDWAKPDSISRTAELGPTRPVGPEDLVGADGRCAVTAPEAALASAPPPVAPAPADRPVGSVAGDLAGAPTPAAPPPAAAPDPSGPTVMGGIALGMTECQAVQRAGLPGNVAISAGDKGQRSVVLTYLSGPWPGIYRFSDGRLNIIDRAPTPPAPPKAPPKKKTSKKKPANAKTSQREIDRPYVQ